MKKILIATTLAFAGLTASAQTFEHRPETGGLPQNRREMFMEGLENEGNNPRQTQKTGGRGNEKTMGAVYVTDSLYSYSWDAAASTFAILWKQIVKYNADGKYTSFIDYEWNAAKKTWVFYDKYERTYDANGDLIERVVSDWDAATNAWVMNLKNVYAYDANRNQIEDSRHNWDKAINAWVGSYRRLYAYNGQGKQSLYTSYNWDAATQAWVGSSKYDYAYDNAGNKTEENYQTWNKAGNVWLNYRKTVYSYDASGKNTEDMAYGWSGTTNTWTNSNKTVYSYDASGKSTETLAYNWSATTNAWGNNSKTVYSYDTNGKKTGTIFYIWSANAWGNRSKQDFSYDANGNTTESATYYWNSTLKIWEGDFRYGYIYDANGNPREQTYYKWVTANNSWIYSSKTVYFRSLLSPPVAPAARLSGLSQSGFTLSLFADKAKTASFELDVAADSLFASPLAGYAAKKYNFTGDTVKVALAGLEGNKAYYARGLAKNGGGSSPYVSIKQFTLPFAPQNARAAKEGLIAVNKITWDNPAGNAAHVTLFVERAEAGGAFAKLNASALPGGTVSYMDANSGTGKSYVYRIAAKNPGGFSNSANSAAVITALETNEISAEGFSVYPNPASGWARIAFSDAPLKNAAVTIADAQGKILPIAVSEKATDGFSIDLSGLPKGVYHLILLTEKGRIVQRIVKE